MLTSAPRHLTTRLGLSCLVAFAVLVSAVGAEAARVTRNLYSPTRMDLLESQIELLERRCAALQADIQGEPLSRSPSEVNDLLFEANFAFLTEDYDHAALLYYSLLENNDLAGHSGEADAQFYMAESLFLSGNYYPAQTSYERIVAIGSTHPHYDDAVMKLIELFGVTGEVEQFNYYYNNFLQTTRSASGPGALRVRYALGRTLYLQAKLPEAKSMFANFPAGSTYTGQARYHYGEILVKEGYAAQQAGDEGLAFQLYQQALPVFQDVVSLPTSTREQVAVQHLGFVALGALYFEMEDLTQAIEAYQQVPNDSDFFADALFQICWAYIVLGDYEGALRTIEIFLLAFPEDTREPDLKLLSAHLRVKLKHFDQAVLDYKTVVEEYEAIKARLDLLVGADVDPMVYFNQLVDDSFITEKQYEVPELAARIARQDRRLSKAVDVAASLNGEARTISASQDTVRRLEDAVRGGESGGLVTTYRTRRQELDGFDAQILSRENDLLQLEANYLIDALGDSDAEGVHRILDSRSEASDAVTAVSAVYTDRKELQEDVEVAARAIDTEAFKLESMIDDILARVAGIEIYLKNELMAGNKSNDEVQGLHLELQAIRVELHAQQDDLSSIHSRMDPKRLSAALVPEIDAEELDQRRQARAQVADLSLSLVDYRARVSGAGSSEFYARVDGARARLRRLRSDGSSLLTDLDRREREEMGQIRRLLDEEKIELVDCSSDARQYERDIRSVSGDIAAASFRAVQQGFEETVLRADMGAIDVYWLRKEEITDEKEQVRDERKQMLQELQRMYQDLLDFEEDEPEEEEAGGIEIE